MKEFKPTRGIHQGDLVSTYLSLLAVEGLSCLLKHAMTSNEKEGINIASTDPNIITWVKFTWVKYVIMR
jgi:hypothetical protein